MANLWLKEFGKTARLALSYAVVEADKRRLMYVEPVHVLLALIGVEAGIKRIGDSMVDLTLLRKTISDLGPPVYSPRGIELELQITASDAVYEALALKRRLKHKALTRGHLLWGVYSYLSPEVQKLLIDQNITRETIEKHVLSE